VSDTAETADAPVETSEAPPPPAAPEVPHAQDDAAATQAEPAQAQPAAQDTAAAPVSYTDFRLPQGIEVDPQTMNEARALLGELKLPQEQAQRLVDFYTGKIRQFGDAQSERWVKLNEKWVNDFKADQEIGGDRVNDTVSAATKAMNRFGTPGLREALIMTGAGNHPEIIRFVARVGKAISEDRYVVSGGASAGGARSAAEVIYPTQGKIQE